MRARHHQLIPASPQRVAHVLLATDQYGSWNSMARPTPDGLRWAVPFVVGGQIRLSARVRETPRGIALTLGNRWTLRIEHLVEIEAGDPTPLTISTRTTGLLRPLGRGLALSRSVESFCHDLTARSFWLRRTPDAHYPHRSPGSSPRPGARDASLEQLPFPTRELEGGKLAIYTHYSCLVIDLPEHRYLHAARDADLERMIAFARWRPLHSITCNADGITIEPRDTHVPLHLSSRPIRAHYTTRSGTNRPPLIA